jgi:hypothetical protein
MNVPKIKAKPAKNVQAGRRLAGRELALILQEMDSTDRREKWSIAYDQIAALAN